VEHPAAAREVGVSRTTGDNWPRGYKTFRHDQVAGFVPALERLAVRQIIAGIYGLTIDTIELYERNMIDELALRLVHGELPVGS
jgi:hypothetical protein